CADHTKNLAFGLPEDGRWQLAPAIDVTFAYNPAGTWTSGHQMTVAGKREGITRQDLLDLGDRLAVPGYRDVIERVTGAVARWPEFAARAGVDDERTRAIGAEHARQRPA